MALKKFIVVTRVGVAYTRHHNKFFVLRRGTREGN